MRESAGAASQHLQENGVGEGRRVKQTLALTITVWNQALTMPDTGFLTRVVCVMENVVSVYVVLCLTDHVFSKIQSAPAVFSINVMI